MRYYRVSICYSPVGSYAKVISKESPEFPGGTWHDDEATAITIAAAQRAEELTKILTLQAQIQREQHDKRKR